MRRHALAVTVVAAVAGCLLLPTAVAAHPLAPTLLTLRELGDDLVEARWSVPLPKPPGIELRPVLPADCPVVEPPRRERLRAGLLERWQVYCPGGLVGRELRVSGLAESGLEALVLLHLEDGRTVRRVLRGGEPSLRITAADGALTVSRDYLILGVEHILLGPDHLCFVLGLLLLVRGRRRLLLTITAFTAGHSVTLSAAVLGWVHLPSAPVEALIAASILLLAVELTRPPPTLTRRSPWWVAAGFGLLHGLGFAGALAEVGLPQAEIPAALLSFNLGIELGQIAFIIVALVAFAALRRLVEPPPWLMAVPAYGLGTVASFWLFERLLGLL